VFTNSIKVKVLAAPAPAKVLEMLRQFAEALRNVNGGEAVQSQILADSAAVSVGVVSRIGIEVRPLAVSWPTTTQTDVDAFFQSIERAFDRLDMKHEAAEEAATLRRVAGAHAPTPALAVSASGVGDEIAAPQARIEQLQLDPSAGCSPCLATPLAVPVSTPRVGAGAPDPAKNVMFDNRGSAPTVVLATPIARGTAESLAQAEAQLLERKKRFQYGDAPVLFAQPDPLHADAATIESRIHDVHQQNFNRAIQEARAARTSATPAGSCALATTPAAAPPSFPAAPTFSSHTLVVAPKPTVALPGSPVSE
jgi:hypothetical protein